MSVGQYFTMQAGWTDERYTSRASCCWPGSPTIIVALAAEGRRTLRAKNAARQAAPST